MKKIIYIENEIKKNQRVDKILSKYSNYEVVYIEKYTEVFNKKNQNFNLQKTNPSILIAKKNKNFLNKIPAKYSIGNKKNFYFSYMYNCPFDCKYCFLQGHYNSANYVIFINYEDYFAEIKKINLKFNNEKITIFSGYDCDSLAYDSYTGFVEQAITFFGKQKNIELELRTKSTLVKPLMKKLEDNVVVAFSFTPSRFSNVYEKDMSLKVNRYVPGTNIRIKKETVINETPKEIFIEKNISGVSAKSNLKKSSCPFLVPLARYKSRIFFTRFLLEIPEARVFGMAVR